MFIHTCEICGNAFESKSNRAKFCADCKVKAQTLRNIKHREKRRAGLSIEVGSEQICPYCQKPYIVVTGSQKCCEDCRKKQTNAAKIDANRRFTAENYDEVKLYVPKGERDNLKAYAESLGMSVNRLFLTALQEYIRNHGEQNDQP